jgi:hypothetical protein
MEFLILEPVYGYEGHATMEATAFTFRAGAGEMLTTRHRFEL